MQHVLLRLYRLCASFVPVVPVVPVLCQFFALIGTT